MNISQEEIARLSLSDVELREIQVKRDKAFIEEVLAWHVGRKLTRDWYLKHRDQVRVKYPWIRRTNNHKPIENLIGGIWNQTTK